MQTEAKWKKSFLESKVRLEVTCFSLFGSYQVIFTTCRHLGLCFLCVTVCFASPPVLFCVNERSSRFRAPLPTFVTVGSTQMSFRSVRCEFFVPRRVWSSWFLPCWCFWPKPSFWIVAWQAVFLWTECILVVNDFIRLSLSHALLSPTFLCFGSRHMRPEWNEPWHQLSLCNEWGAASSCCGDSECRIFICLLLSFLGAPDGLLRLPPAACSFLFHLKSFIRNFALLIFQICTSVDIFLTASGFFSLHLNFLLLTFPKQTRYFSSLHQQTDVDLSEHITHGSETRQRRKRRKKP